MNGTSAGMADPPVRAMGRRRRISFGLGLFALLVGVFVALPVYGLSLLSARGVTTGADDIELAAGGLVLAALFAIAYVVRPTRWFGTALAVRAIAGIGYLLLLAPLATAQATLGGGLSGAVVGSGLFVWLAASPVIGLVAALLVILSDSRDLSVRLRREFPLG